MRSTIVAMLVFSSLCVSSTAFAREHAKGKKTKAGKRSAPALVASAEALPPLPPPVLVASAPLPAPMTLRAPRVVASRPGVAADRASAAPARPGRPSAGGGFVLEVGTGVTVLGGSVAHSMGVGAGFANIDLKLGGYFNDHVGVMAGIVGGYGSLFSGCAGSCSLAYSYAIPLTLQVAVQDRSRGLYFEGGAALVSTYVGLTDPDDDKSSPETLEMSSPADVRLGIGYRFADASTVRAASHAVELRLGADIGQFKSIDYTSVAGEAHGDVASSKQAVHVAVGLSLGYVFTP